ncbi:reverse transcriptase domain-containing protein, partial [Tanacetum coccineum]
MPSHFYKKFRWGIAFATGLKHFTDPVTKLRIKHTNCRVRIPKGLYPHRIEAKLTKKLVGGKWIVVREMTMISKDREISKFTWYRSSEEEKEPSEQPEPYDLYGFVEYSKLQRKEFAPHRLPQREGNMNGWLIEDEDEPLEYEASDKEVESDLESTGCVKLRSVVIGGQLQNIIPLIVTQVTANVNNANGENGNGRNDRCSYKTFTTCNPKEFDGKGGAVALTRWIEKMELVFDNSGCTTNQRVRYAASCFVNKALTWWNTEIQARGREAVISMSWNDFKALLMEEFCPSNEMEKLENEFWNHTMVGANHVTYTDRFHELAKQVPHLVTPESSRIKRYIHGLIPQILGMLRATQPTTIQSAILMAGILTNEAIRCGTLTKGNDSQGNKNTRNNGNQARGKAFNRNAVEALQDPKVVIGTFSLNNQFATVLFDSGADFSFISTKFMPLLNVEPCILNPGYAIEIADGKSVEVGRVIRDCKLELGNSLFTIDLIPLGHGSFDVIVGMDWLSRNKAVIVCHEK